MRTKARALALSLILFFTGFAAISFQSDVAQAQGASDYVAYWSFDEGTGTLAADASANHYDGTVNGASWTNGISGGALDFNGVNDYVGVVSSSSLNNLNVLTFEAWIHPRVNSHWHVISKGDGSKRLYSEAGTSARDLTGRVRYSPTHAYATSIDNTVNLNAWQHVVMTWSSATNTVRLYRNGAEVSYATLTTGSGTIEDDSSYPYAIGARGDLASGCFFDGIIDEVYIWGRVLTPSEIMARHRSTTLPGAPQNLAATPGNTQITLNWEAPANAGSSPITNYRIYRGVSPGATTFIYEVGNVLAYTDTGLTNGVTYYYNITAVNGNGEGLSSNETSATPAVTPSSPRNLAATPGDSLVHLNWSAPASDGGSAITNYRIYRGASSGGETFLVEIGNLLTHTDTGLTNGQTYYYTVSAVNGNGEGPNSTEISIAPMTVPALPQNLQITAGNGYIYLSWNPPSENGGSAISNYTIYRGTTSGGETMLARIGNLLYYNDTSVINNQTYYYTIRAVNSAGEGGQSTEASAIPTSQGQPGQGDSIPFELIMLIMFLVIVLIILFLYFRSRKSRKPKEPETIPQAVMPEKKDEKGLKIDLGRNHLFLTENVEETFHIFRDIVEKGHPGLCLTNKFPDKLRDDFGLGGARIMWFSETAAGPDIYKPQRLDFEITKTTTKFIKENKEPVVLIDGLDYLILTNGFENVSTFLKRLTDISAMQRATLVVVVRPEAITPDRISYLKGQFDRVA